MSSPRQPIKSGWEEGVEMHWICGLSLRTGSDEALGESFIALLLLRSGRRNNSKAPSASTRKGLRIPFLKFELEVNGVCWPEDAGFACPKKPSKPLLRRMPSSLASS